VLGVVGTVPELDPEPVGVAGPDDVVGVGVVDVALGVGVAVRVGFLL
jgi:hypothetical protein